MNTFLYDDGSEADELAGVGNAAYWDEMFDISRMLHTLGLHK